MLNKLHNDRRLANWFTRYYSYLFNFSMARVKDRQKAEDMVQDTFLKALKKREQFQGSSSEKTWLTAILKNNIYDAQRRESKLVTESQIVSSEISEDDFFDDHGSWKEGERPAMWQSEQIDGLEQKELAGTLEKCIGVLPENWAFIFKLKFMDDEESEVICERMDITNQNFWTIIHRAKLKLRSCLKNFWFGDK